MILIIQMHVDGSTYWCLMHKIKIDETKGASTNNGRWQDEERRMIECSRDPENSNVQFEIIARLTFREP